MAKGSSKSKRGGGANIRNNTYQNKMYKPGTTFNKGNQRVTAKGLGKASAAGLKGRAAESAAMSTGGGGG